MKNQPPPPPPPPPPRIITEREPAQTNWATCGVKSTGKSFYLFNYTKNGEDTFYTFAFYADTIETARARFEDLVKPQNGDAWQEFRITGLTQEGCHNA